MLTSAVSPPLPRFSAMIDRIGGDHKAYQYHGVQWCVDEERRGRGGGLIADEMVLGHLSHL